MNSMIRAAYFCVALVVGGSTAAEIPMPQVTVLAAVSLTEALEELAASYEQSAHVHLRLSFAASSALARQLEAGADADVYFAADPDWMDYLAERGLIDPASRRDVLGNRLVLVAPASSTLRLRIGRGASLLAALGTGRLAMGEPDSVPAGRYARAALVRLGVWDSVKTHIAVAENARSALALVAREEAPLGVVYETDARIEPRVRIVDRFADDVHPPIRYPVALTPHARREARGFLTFLQTDAARAVFRRYGFTALQ